MDTTLEPTAVVTAFLQFEGRIMLVQRSSKVGSYRGRWSAISGYLEDREPLAQARREIREETGLPDAEVHFIAAGEPFEVPAQELNRLWVVHPFLFAIDDPKHVRLDWENVQCRWLAPDELQAYPKVPKLEEALGACVKSLGNE